MSYSPLSLPFRIVYLTHAWFFTFDVLLLSRRRARTPLAILTLLIFFATLVYMYSKCSPSAIIHTAPSIPLQPVVESCTPSKCEDNTEWFRSSISSVISRLDGLENKVQKCDCPPPVQVQTSHSSPDTPLIQQICGDMLTVYDADRIGIPDFALESGGGSVVSTRCSETYVEKMGRYYMFNFIPLFWKEPSPRLAIQPIRDVGECWPFKGTVGYLVIQLSRRIFVESFTLEHIPSSIALEGHIRSAPKDFQVFGLSSSDDRSGGELLGNFTYQIEGHSWQNFKVDQSKANETFEFVELKILTNHGNVDYTCLYRFRVHGKAVEEKS